MTRIFNLNELRNIYKDKIISTTFSCWDLLNPNDIMLLKYAKSNSDILCVGLQKNTVLYNPESYNPIQSLDDRETMIESCKYVDYYFIYDTEFTLYDSMNELKPNICIFGNIDNITNCMKKTINNLSILPIEIIYYPYYNYIDSITELRRKFFLRESK